MSSLLLEARNGQTNKQTNKQTNEQVKAKNQKYKEKRHRTGRALQQA
jgi:hypothetical protein